MCECVRVQVSWSLFCLRLSGFLYLIARLIRMGNPDPFQDLAPNAAWRGTILLDPASNRCAIELQGPFHKPVKYFVLRFIDLFWSVRLVEMKVEDVNGVSHRVKFICFEVNHRKFDGIGLAYRLSLTPYTDELYNQLKTIYWPSFGQAMSSTVTKSWYLPEFRFVNVICLAPNRLEQMSSWKDFVEVLQTAGIGETATFRDPWNPIF